MTLRAHLPEAYPATAPPLVVLEGRAVTDDVTQWALFQLEELYAPGENVLYAWVEAVREHLESVLQSDDSDGGHDPAVAMAVAASEAEQREQVTHQSSK